MCNIITFHRYGFRTEEPEGLRLEGSTSQPKRPWVLGEIHRATHTESKSPTMDRPPTPPLAPPPPFIPQPPLATYSFLSSISPWMKASKCSQTCSSSAATVSPAPRLHQSSTPITPTITTPIILSLHKNFLRCYPGRKNLNGS